jgi:hypothetical protein
MKSIYSLILVAILAVTAPAARAAVEDGTTIDPRFVAPLMAWVENATGTKAPALPRVLASMRHLKFAMGLEGVRQARSMAAYVPGQVVLNNLIWDEESVRSVSYLVHELVHHAQMFSNKRYPCPEAKEYEAYTLQNQWLAEQGEDPIVTVGFIKQMATCPTGGA